MKNKFIKNTGIMLGVSSIIFASSKNKKLEKEKLENKPEYRAVKDLFNDSLKDISKSDEFTRKLIEAIYKTEEIKPDKNSKEKTVKLKLSLKKDVKKNDLTSVLKDKLKLPNTGKNVIIADSRCIITKWFNEENNLNTTYKNYIDQNRDFISIELNSDGSVNSIDVYDDDNKRKKLLAEICFDTKVLFEDIENNIVEHGDTEKEKQEEKGKVLEIIKVLKEMQLGFGQHTLDDEKLTKVIKAIKRGEDSEYNHRRVVFTKDEVTNKFECSSTPEVDKFEKGVEYNQMTTWLNSGILKESDLVISILENEKLLLIAKGSDIKSGNIKGQNIDENFYKQIVKNITDIEKLRIFTENGNDENDDKRNISCCPEIQGDTKTALTNSIIDNFNNTSDNCPKKFNLETGIEKVEVREYASCFELTYNNGTLTIGNEIPCNTPDKLKLDKNKMYLVVFKQIGNDDANKKSVLAAIVKNEELTIKNDFTDFVTPGK
jgi:hypothetical protein